MSDNHIGSIESQHFRAAYTATCTCGWKSEERPTEREAKADLARHYDEAESQS